MVMQVTQEEVELSQLQDEIDRYFDLPVGEHVARNLGVPSGTPEYVRAYKALDEEHWKAYHREWMRNYRAMNPKPPSPPKPRASMTPEQIERKREYGRRWSRKHNDATRKGPYETRPYRRK